MLKWYLIQKVKFVKLTVTESVASWAYQLYCIDLFIRCNGNKWCPDNLCMNMLYRYKKRWCKCDVRNVNITNWILCMAKILSDGLQSSQYAFIVLYICAYAHKSSYHHNKINWFLNLLELTISLNYQFASYKTRIPRPPFFVFNVWLLSKNDSLSVTRESFHSCYWLSSTILFTMEDDFYFFLK